MFWIVLYTKINRNNGDIFTWKENNPRLATDEGVLRPIRKNQYFLLKKIFHWIYDLL